MPGEDAGPTGGTEGADPSVTPGAPDRRAGPPLEAGRALEPFYGPAAEGPKPGQHRAASFADPAARLAERLEEFARRLREEGAAILDRPYRASSADPIDSLLVGLLAGLLAGSDDPTQR